MPERNSLYEHAWKVYEQPNSGEPVAEDGYVPRNRYAKPNLYGIMPDITDTNYKVLNDPILIKKKQELRAALKEEYKKNAYNPYRQAAAAGGVPFDSNVHRYITMLRTQTSFFRPTVRTTFLGAMMYFGCPMLLYYWLKTAKEKEEKMYRSGAVAYADRPYKFMI